MHKRTTAVLGAVMAIVLGTGVVLASHQFSDVPNSNTFHAQIAWLTDNGITGGCGGGKYCPNDPVTRGQMAAFLYRYYLKFGSGSGPAGPPGPTGDPGPQGDPGEHGPSGATVINLSLPVSPQQYDGQDLATVGPFTFRAECWRTGPSGDYVWNGGIYLKSSAAYSRATVGGGNHTLQPGDNYHGHVIAEENHNFSYGTFWVPADPFQGAAPDGTMFSAHLWLGFHALGSTADECQFGGTITH
jgi:S-layer homology domain